MDMDIVDNLPVLLEKPAGVQAVDFDFLEYHIHLNPNAVSKMSSLND